MDDQAFLAGYKDDATLVCPTCSHVHTTTFYARQALAFDSQDIHEVVIRLQADLGKLRAKESVLQPDLDSVASRLRKLNESLNVRRAGRPVADVVVAKSLSTLKQAYDQTRHDLAAEIDTLAERKKELNDELAALTDKGREKRIKEFFSEKLVSVADESDINKAEISSKVKLSSRSPNASGSNAPRAVLAMHLALLSTHREFGDGPSFPFIVDTPQQSGQDPTSLGRMLSAILGSSISGQTMVATESIPEGWVPPAGCRVLNFENKRSLLGEDEFRKGVDALSYMVKTMHEAILAADPDAKEDAEGTVAPPDEADEDDED